MGAETVFRFDDVVIDHSESAIVDVIGVVVLPEGKRMVTVEPAEIAVQAVLGSANGDWGVGCFLHDSVVGHDFNFG